MAFYPFVVEISQNLTIMGTSKSACKISSAVSVKKRSKV
jgi:hypothetical protein